LPLGIASFFWWWWLRELVLTLPQAFPVLCRILTELKLLGTTVGIIVLSAGVGNDVVGWILLALCVALVNTNTGLTALWVLLVAVGYALFLAFAVRPSFLWVLRRTRALQDGPSQGIVALTLMIALASAFFTGIIGIHPIFGAFMAGLICPHEGGFRIKLTEKVEDLISALFLPLYFALSGLSTNLGLLNSGMTWAYVVGIIAVAFFAKFIGASLAARLCGLVWRECFTIGSLMSCKGLVELIVLVSRCSSCEIRQNSDGKRRTLAFKQRFSAPAPSLCSSLWLWSRLS
jgi:Kef-type K+ transport system membrane component KefB